MSYNKQIKRLTIKTMEYNSISAIRWIEQLYSVEAARALINEWRYSSKNPTNWQQALFYAASRNPAA